MQTKIQTLALLSLLSFGIVSFVYSENNQWNLAELSKASPDAKAWVVQVEGDSVLIRNANKQGKRQSNQQRITQKKGKGQDFEIPFPIYKRDVIATGVDDRATILLRDGSVIWVESLTVFKVSSLNVPSVVPGQSAENYKVNLKLRVGAVRVRVPKVRTIQKKFAVQTPKGTASVRGTEQVVQYSPEFGLQVRVLSGLVEIQNQAQRRQYATRGERVTVNRTTKDSAQTVNQEKRSQAEKNVQIASGNSVQVQEITKELQNIAFLPLSIPPITPPAADLSPISTELRNIVNTLLANPDFTTQNDPGTIKLLKNSLNKNETEELVILREWIRNEFGSTKGFVNSLKEHGYLLK